MTISPINNPVITGIQQKTANDAPGLLASLISSVIGLLLIIAALWSFIQLIHGGILWISSGGDKSSVEAARHRIIDAITGLTIVAASWALFLFILSYFGISEGGVIFNFPTIF